MCVAAYPSESWSISICNRLKQIWQEGNNELLFSGYAWHNRYTYRREKIKTYNEKAWGSGIGKGLYDEKGNWHGLFALAFMDSHNKLEPNVGYAYLKMAQLDAKNRVGAGYIFIITSRRDIFNGIPFPGVLTWISLNHRKLNISATYIPSAAGAGNVLYIFGRWTLDL